MAWTACEQSGGCGIPNAPLGLLASFQRLRKRILSRSAGQTLGGQFRLRRFHSVCSNSRLTLQSSDSFQYLIFGQTLMAQFRLEIADHCLRLRQ
jgi:hypothetical protein